jgi:PAS domain S-box-containing protein
VITLLLGGLVSLGFNLVYSSGLMPNPHLDLTPYAFYLSGVIVAIGLFRYRMFDVVPLARDAVLEDMYEGVVVLDAQDRIADLNAVAQEILGRSSEWLIGRPAEEAFAGFPGLVERFRQAGDLQEELAYEEGGRQRTYALRVSTLMERQRGVIGRILVWSDISSRKQAEQALRRQLEELSILHSVAAAGVEATSEDSLIERATQIIGDSIYPDNFGLLLLDEARGGLVPHPSYHSSGEPRENSMIPLGQGITGLVAASGKTKRVPDVTLEPAYFELDPHTRSELCVPLKIGERVIGAINAESKKPDAFSESDERLLVTLAGQLATAIDRLRAETTTKRNLREVTFLSQIISITATESDLPSALQRVCAELAEFFRVPEVSFALFNSQLTVAQVIAESHDPDRKSSLGVQFSVDENTALQYILQEARYLAITDVTNDPWMTSLQGMIEGREICSLLLIPILFGGEVVGILGIDDVKPRQFIPEEIDLVQKVASQVSQVLERLGLFAATREQAERMAQLASLSEALNRPLTESEVVAGIGQAAMALGTADRVAVYVRHLDDKVSVPWSMGLSPEYIGQVSVRISELPGGNLLKGKEPVLITDLQKLSETSLLRKLGEMENFRAVELWPLVYEDYVIAAIGCYYNDVHPWSDAEQEVMLAFTRQAAVALQNARLFDETRRRAAYLEALNAVITAVAAAVDLRDLLETTLDQTLRALQLKAGGIWVREHRAVRGLPADVGEKTRRISQEKRLNITTTIVVEDWQVVAKADPLAGMAPEFLEAGIRASLTVPILSEGRRIGGLSVAAPKPRAWLAEEVALIEAVGRQLGGAVERIELLEKIRDQARQVEQIVESVPEGVLLLDDQLQVVLANPTARDYLADRSVESALGNLFKRGGRQLKAMISQDEQDIWRELEIPGPPRLVFELAVQPLKAGDPSGGWVMVLRDVTRERESQARIQMQERLATVGQLAAGIAHDFNNIMAAIVVYADLLRRDPNLPQSSHDRLKIIQNQVQRASSLIRQILDFSRRSVMEQSIIDLLPFIKELDKLLRRILPETIRLELSYQPGTYLVNADPARLQQVFMNLAVNARDASPEGGRLHFQLDRLTVLPGEEANFKELPPGDWVHIAVQDTGEGISPEAVPHIFEPFFTTKPVGQGTGLGLAQAYGIIKQHGGFIDVESQLGVGTTFHIFLPAEAPASQEAPGLEGPVEIKGGGETLLVVEDDISAREALKALLEASNYRVLTASNGVEALKIYEVYQGQISLVVSDVVMPVMGGIALHQALRERWPEVKMLFVTGHPVKEQDQAILEEGQVHWLQKPFSVQVFSQAVFGLLNVVS